MKKRDSILISEFNANTRHGFEKFFDANLMPGRLEGGDLDMWAMNYFLLKNADDSPDWFPSGKWATIHRLEAMLDEAASVSLELK